MKKLAESIVVVFLVSLSSALYGDVYFGAAAGKSNSEDAGSASDLSWFAYSEVTKESADTKDTAFSLYFGYEFMFNDVSIAVEAGLVDFGENTLRAEGYSLFPGIDERRTATLTAEADAATLSAQIKKKYSPNIGVFGRFGISSWDVSGKMRGTAYNNTGGTIGSVTESASDNGTDPYFGFGIEYKFVRVEIDRYKIADTDTDYISIGFQF